MKIVSANDIFEKSTFPHYGLEDVMTDRERLVELFQHDNCPLFMVFGDKVDVLADYLIAHGVTVSDEIEELIADNNRLRDMWAKAVSDLSKATSNAVIFSKNATVESKWIPVSERLPERFDGVLLWCDSNKYAFIGFKNGYGEWCVPGFETGVNFRITHWMPLPAPPKEG